MFAGGRGFATFDRVIAPAVLEPEHIRIGATIQRIVALVRDQRVIARFAISGIIAQHTGQQVISGSAIKRVMPAGRGAAAVL